MSGIAYFPGCSLHSMSKEYDTSFRSVCRKIGLELKEIKGWVCCGATPVASTDHLFSLSLSFKNISFAEKMGLKEIVAPCASCYMHLRNALCITDKPGPLLKELEEVCETKVSPDMEVIHTLELYSRAIQDFTNKTVRDISGLKIACYYGCQIIRPPKIMDFDHTEEPESMDNILKAFGVLTVDWDFKTECCGASFAMIRPEIMVELSGRILKGAIECGADLISVACPLCHFSLDSRQEEAKAKYQLNRNIPIVYITQLMGYALGVNEADQGFKRHFNDPRAVLSK